MTKKATINLNGVILEMNTEFKFRSLYDEWVKTCKGTSETDIYSKGGSLYHQVREHVTVKTRRPKSKNAGNDGAYKLVDKITKYLKKNYFTEANLDELEGFLDDLEVYGEHDSLNPQNIIFHNPKNWDTVDGKVVVSGKEKNTIYGHYLDDYFTAKFKTPNKMGSWVSDKLNTATPPLWQALFSDGKHDLNIVGLATILKTAIKEIEDASYEVTITKLRDVQKFVSIPEIRRYVMSGLMKKAAHFKGGKPDLNAMAATMATKRFNFSDANADKVLEAAGKPELAGHLNKISFKFNTATISRLIKTSYSAGNKDYWDAKTPSGEKLVMKSWTSMLFR